jgi:hypothetical protein
VKESRFNRSFLDRQTSMKKSFPRSKSDLWSLWQGGSVCPSSVVVEYLGDVISAPDALDGHCDERVPEERTRSRSVSS